jgi:DNA-binding beta-propeller fold protein YncE
MRHLWLASALFLAACPPKDTDTDPDSDTEADTTAPTAVPSVMASGPGPFTVEWSYEDDGDAIGVVLVRFPWTAWGELGDGPHAAGDAVDGGGTVVYVGDAGTFSDNPETPGLYRYAAYTVDAAGNVGPHGAAWIAKAIPEQTTTLSIDVGAGTATLSGSPPWLGLTAAMSTAANADSGVDLTLTFTLTNNSVGMVHNPKVVLPEAEAAAATSEEATLIQRGDDLVIHFGASLLPGASRTVSLTFAGIPADTTDSAELEVRGDRAILAGAPWWSDNDSPGAPIHDLGAGGPGAFLSAEALRGYGGEDIAAAREGDNQVSGWAFDPTGQFVFASGANSAAVVAFDLSTLEVARSVDLPADSARGSTGHMVVAPDGSLLVVHNDGWHTKRWEPSYWQSGTSPYPDTHKVLVHRIDPDTFQVLDTVELADGPAPLPAEDMDTDTDSDTADPDSIGVLGKRMSVSPDGSTLAVPVIYGGYADHSNKGRVYLVDLGSFEVDRMIELGPREQPSSTAFSGDGDTLLVTVGWPKDEGVVHVIDLTDDSVAAEPISTANENYPNGVARLPDGRVVVHGWMTGETGYLYQSFVRGTDGAYTAIADPPAPLGRALTGSASVSPDGSLLVMRVNRAPENNSAEYRSVIAYTLPDLTFAGWSIWPDTQVYHNSVAVSPY